MNNTEKKQRKRRKEIIEAVTPLLEKTPLTELSIKDICKEAGISIGSFYHYFEQKDDLGIAMIMKSDEYLVDNIFPQMTSEDAVENIRIWAMGVTRYVSDIGVERAKFVMANFRPTDYDVDGNFRPEIVKINETISDGQKKGQITTEHTAEELTEFVRTAVQGIGIEWTRRDGVYSLTDKMERFLNVFLRGLRNEK